MTDWDIEVREPGCTIASTYDDLTVIVLNASGKYDVRHISTDWDTEKKYVDQYTVGASDWATEAEAFAYACGYDSGARENM